jgi:hypothetical protein
VTTVVAALPSFSLALLVVVGILMGVGLGSRRWTWWALLASLVLQPHLPRRAIRR